MLLPLPSAPLELLPGVFVTTGAIEQLVLYDFDKTDRDVFMLVLRLLEEHSSFFRHLGAGPRVSSPSIERTLFISFK